MGKFSDVLNDNTKREDRLTGKMTPLHLAIKEGNNRSINLIMKYISKMKCNNGDTYSDTLTDLVETKYFIPMLNSMSFVTL